MSQLAKERWRDGTLSSPEVQRKRITGQRKAKRRKKAEAQQHSTNGNGKHPNAEVVHVIEEAPIGRIDPVEYAAVACVGRIQGVIEEAARGVRLPSAVVAERVVELLRAATRR
jgi:hypothetical protein